MFTCVSIVFVVLFCRGHGQDPVTEITTAMTISDAICSKCKCNENTVDCRSLDIRTSFVLEEWQGLRVINPTEVDLSGNSITRFQRVSELPIQVLNLSRCELESIEDGAFMNLGNLTKLDLSNNKISTSALSRKMFMGIMMPGGKLPRRYDSLRYISLANNDIHSLPQDIFFFTSEVTHMDLSGNPLDYIDPVTMAALSDLTKLTDLKLNSCVMETLPDGLLRRQRKLERLDVSDNRFTKIPATIGEAVNLVYLNLDKNPIESLTEKTSISNLTNLEELHMSKLYQMKSIGPHALSGLSKLVELHLNYNYRLSSIDPSFLMWEDNLGCHKWPMLKKLYLNNNNLSVISSSILDSWNELQDLDFTNNPYECECSTQWMVDVLMPIIANTDANATANKMICKKPKEMFGMSLAQLAATSAKLMCDGDTSNAVPEANTVIMLGIMIGVFLTFPLMLLVVIAWRKGYFARCRKTKAAETYEEDELYSY